MDQKKANGFSQAFGYMLIVFSLFMLLLGISILISENKSSFEYQILFLSLGSGVLMLFGGINQISKAKRKDIEVTIYEEKVRSQLKKIENPLQQESSTTKDILGEAATGENSIPDIIANWNYTKEEWKCMTQMETRRRLKEGIWVSMLVGVLGGLFLSWTRELSYTFSFSFALAFGILVALLKVAFSNNVFLLSNNNRVIITPNALLINHNFKTISDSSIGLEYIKLVKLPPYTFIEFSLEWNTRKGPTNDQFRILVPLRYENEIETVLQDFQFRGVKIISAIE